MHSTVPGHCDPVSGTKGHFSQLSEHSYTKFVQLIKLCTKNTQPNKWLFLIYFLFFQISTIVSVLLSLVPFTFLIILNILIFRTIKQKTPALSRSSRRQRRDIFVASILILIIMVYAACHSIKVFINILELFCILTGKNLWPFPPSDSFSFIRPGFPEPMES